MDIVAKCEKCGRGFVWIPDHCDTDAYTVTERGADGLMRTTICGGHIVRLCSNDSPPAERNPQ